ncbi:MAG: hypothetical protein KAR06_10215 [Deltaproteobacteria bacterium]|nr:hypothetical protein [Deltaproteobacteria bacterium]
MFIRNLKIFFLALSCTLACAATEANAQERRTTDEETKGGIIQRVIKIEGAVEKPRTIFILPKADFFEETYLKRSFEDELLEPLGPEHVRDLILN